MFFSQPCGVSKSEIKQNPVQLCGNARGRPARFSFSPSCACVLGSQCRGQSIYLLSFVAGNIITMPSCLFCSDADFTCQTNYCDLKTTNKWLKGGKKEFAYPKPHAHKHTVHTYVFLWCVYRQLPTWTLICGARQSAQYSVIAVPPHGTFSVTMKALLRMK